MVSDAQSYQAPQGAFVFFRPKPDGDIDPAGEAGWFLQRERERRGESLEEAGWACDIHPHHLQAIESGDLTGLPSRSEALEMVGAYGDYLRFDPEPLKRHYAQFLPKAAAPVASLAQRIPRPLGSAKIIAMPYLRMAREQMAGAGGIVASVAGAVLLFGVAAWLLTPSAEDRLAATPPPAAEQTAAQAPAQQQQPTTGTAQVTNVSSISGVTETPLDDTKSISAADSAIAEVDSLAALIERETKGEIAAGDGQAAGVASVASATAAPQPQAAPAAAGQGKVYGSENADARVVLTAVEDVWIRLEENGQVVLSQTLMRGDTVRVPNRPGMMVIARDGGLVSVSVDGVDKGTLGRRGEIVVGRSVDARSLTSG